MQWFKITVETSSEAVDAVSNALFEAGAEGTQIEDAADFKYEKISNTGAWLDPDTIKHRQSGAAISGFFSPKAHITELKENLQAKVNQLASFGLDPGIGKVTVSAVAEADWANVWKKYYHPVRISRYLTIVPKWEDYTPQQKHELVIKLDPGMAFGTGTHPTTALMLRLLEADIRGGESVIDVGTGSGILAIAAKMLGCSRVLATDIDEVATANAKSNLALNPVTGIDVVVSDLLSDCDQKADLILANILAEVLVPLIPQAKARLLPKGHLLLSGIFYDKIDLIEETLKANQLQVQTKMTQGDWCAIDAVHQGADEA